jgi:hypothetical protein
MKFVHQHKLVDQVKPDPRLRALHGVQRAATLLQRQCGCHVYVSIPFGTEYTFVLAIFRNYTIKYDFKCPKIAGAAIDRIRYAIDDPDQDPMWYYDSTDTEGKDIREFINL